jgi:hypothetical protein
MIQPIQVIRALHEAEPFLIEVFTEGSCFHFFVFLRTLFPNAMPVVQLPARDHIGTLIDGVVYDITGIVDWDWELTTTKELQQFERSRFTDNYTISGRYANESSNVQCSTMGG